MYILGTFQSAASVLVSQGKLLSMLALYVWGLSFLSPHGSLGIRPTDF